MLKTGGRPPLATFRYKPSPRNPVKTISPAPAFTRSPTGKLYKNDYTSATTHGEFFYVQRDLSQGTVSELLRNHVSLPYAIGTGALTDDDLAAEDNDTEFVAFVTNRDIDGVGIDPAKNPIGHDSSNTVWGAAEDYRGRWSVETTFRQVKYQFLAKSRSRDLGVRRFCWMLAIILYNSWAVLNLMIQRSVPTVSDDRPPVRANVFLEEMAARARRWPPP